MFIRSTGRVLSKVSSSKSPQSAWNARKMGFIHINDILYRINLQRLCHETNKVFTLREVFLYTCTGKLDVWTFNGETDHPSRNCVVARFFVPRDYDSHFCKWSLKCLNIRYIISNRKVTSWFFFLYCTLLLQWV